MKDIYIVFKNSYRVFSLQEVAFGIDEWDKLDDEKKELMLDTCGIIGIGYREHWWEFWKPKIIGYKEKLHHEK